MNNLLLVFSDLEHSFFNRTKKLREKPSYHSYETANSQLPIHSLESTKGLVGLDIVSLFLCFCFALPLFSLSWNGKRTSFSLFVAWFGLSEWNKWVLLLFPDWWRSKLKIESSGVWIPMFVLTQMIDELDLESMLTSLLSKVKEWQRDWHHRGWEGPNRLPLSWSTPWWVLYSSQHEIGRYVT